MTEQHTLKYMLIWTAIMIPLIVIAAAVSLGWFKYGLVKYRGHWMRCDFAEKLNKDQEARTYGHDGRDYTRIPYGSERDVDWGADVQPCHDCSAVKGELHAKGCDVERCPVCGGQVITCPCKLEGADK